MINKKQLKELSGMQKHCVDIIGPNNITDRFKANRIPTVEQLIKLKQCKLSYKLSNHLLPVGVEKTMTTDHNERTIVKCHRYPNKK